MAFWSFYKRINNNNSYRLNKYPDMIYWFKEYVLKTPEQREMEHTEAIELLKMLSSLSLITQNLGSTYNGGEY